MEEENKKNEIEKKENQSVSPEGINTPTVENITRVNPDIQFVNQVVYSAISEVDKVVVGQSNTLKLMLAGLFTGGHILMEGVPGIAKTMLVNLLSKTLAVDFTRIQFTPDLMPSDITGTMVYNAQASSFHFRKGPIFSNAILIDEINRAPAKTQAALFEVMEEKQVTVDGETHKMSYPLFVVATQNPIEQEGTYKLPEAQLDRFLFKVKVDYPKLKDEVEILKRFRNDFDKKIKQEVNPIIQPGDIEKCSAIIEKISIKDELLEYIANIVYDTRNNGDLYLGASPRASLSILKTAKAIAAFNERDFVTPDDIKFVAFPALNHRIILSPEKEMEGGTTEEVIEQILQKIEVPR